MRKIEEIEEVVIYSTMNIPRTLFGWSPPHIQPLTPVSEVSEPPESPSPYPYLDGILESREHVRIPLSFILQLGFYDPLYPRVLAKTLVEFPLYQISVCELGAQAAMEVQICGENG